MLNSPIKKIPADISGKIIKFEKRFDYRKELTLTDIIIKCSSTVLKEPIQEKFNFSSKWQKLNLKEGDTVNFKATIRETTFYVHKTERWEDEWNVLPPHLTEEVIEIDILQPNQITKISA